MKKSVIMLFVFVLAMLSFANQTVGEKNYLVQEVTLYGEGNSVNDYQLGFLWPEGFEEGMEGFQGWLMMYSVRDINEVWSFLKGLSEKEILELSDTDNLNRLYRITNYDWADGYPNTFRGGQKDVITENEFGPGLYNTFLATFVNGEIKAIVQAETIDVKPYPKYLTLVYETISDNIEDYGLKFNSYEDDRIKGNFIFYSKFGLNYINEFLSQQINSFEDIIELYNENRGKFTECLEGTFNYNINQKDILSNEYFAEGVYYNYAVSIGKDGVLGISTAVEMIITKPAPKISKEFIGNGIGTILAIGGAASIGNPDSEELFEYLRQTSGGTDNYNPKIAIINSSRDSVFTAYEHFHVVEPSIDSQYNRFKNAGFDPIYIPIAVDSREYVMNNEYWVNLLKNCDAVFLMGGDQFKHQKSFYNDDGSPSKLMKALIHIYNRGGVIAGSSAGTHFMSDPIFGVGNPYESFFYNKTEEFKIKDIPVEGYLNPQNSGNNIMVPALSLVPYNSLTDTHFDARGRLARLLVGLRDSKNQIGIGVDEGTAISITKNEIGQTIGKVIGHNAVFILDTRNAKFSDPGKNNLFEAENIILHYLTEGDLYNFATNKVLVSSNKKRIMNPHEQLYETESIFNKYETTKTLIGLINSSDNNVIAAVEKPSNFTKADPNFEVEFKKHYFTRSYVSNSPYFIDKHDWDKNYSIGDSELEGYYKKSIVDIILNVRGFKGIDEFSVIEIERASEYTQYIHFSKTVDPETIKKESVIISGNNNYWVDEPYPSVTISYDNQVKIPLHDSIAEGNKIIINNVKDLDGNSINETWIYTNEKWVKQLTIDWIEITSEYTQYFHFNKPVYPKSVSRETFVLEINDYWSDPRVTNTYDNQVILELEDPRAEGTIVTIKDIKDFEGTSIRKISFIYIDGEWIEY